VKGSVLRQLVESSPVPIPLDELTPTLRELVSSPPLPSQWVSEVQFNTLMLAHEDVYPKPAFREWVYARNRKLFNSSLYRILFLVVSPERLVSQMSSRWGAFRRGTELVVVDSTPKHFIVDVRYPSFLYDSHVIANLKVAATAALDAAGGHDPRVSYGDIGETRTRFDIRWA
jgi:hypothetical protein